jgi:hypothetical protein
MRVIPQGIKPGTAAELNRRRQLVRGGFYRPTVRARQLLRPVTFANNHSAVCTCLACVATRIGFRR